MENQHRKIKGYRELSQEEIDLMNRIKVKGAELLDLHAELVTLLDASKKSKHEDAIGALAEGNDIGEELELSRFVDAEPHRWAAIGKTDIQTGIMALVRAVAQPGGV